MKRMLSLAMAAMASFLMVGCGDTISEDLVPKTADVVVHMKFDADGVEDIVEAWNEALEDAEVKERLPEDAFKMLAAGLAVDGEMGPVLKPLLTMDEDGKPTITEVLVAVDYPENPKRVSNLEDAVKVYAYVMNDDVDMDEAKAAVKAALKDAAADEGEWVVVKKPYSKVEYGLREIDGGYAITQGDAEVRKTVDALLEGDAETIDGKSPLMVAFDKMINKADNGVAVAVNDPLTVADLAGGKQEAQAFLGPLLANLTGAGVIVTADEDGLNIKVAAEMRYEEAAEELQEMVDSTVEEAEKNLEQFEAALEIVDTVDTDVDDKTTIVTLTVDIDEAAELIKTFEAFF